MSFHSSENRCKTLLKTFDSVLREKVKTLAPKGTREIFEELSKEITLRDAFLSKYAVQNRSEILSAFDLLLGGGGFLGAGPLGAIGSVALKKTVQSPLAKTLTANALRAGQSLGKPAQVLSKPLKSLILSRVSQSKP